ncbi:MAG: M28 family metallopeptidase [Planctomycetota bacterium]|jgi:acetylornithine deacetylase/succinyl-diaminopimelate desuccinylase-like protein
MKAFDARKAYEYACAVARPRRTGSPGEAATVEYITDKLKGFGLEVRQDVFSYSTVFRLFLKITIASILVSLLVVFFLFPYNPFLTGVLVTFMLFLVLRAMSGVPFVATLRGLLFRDIPFTGRQESRNIIATTGSGGKGNDGNKPHVYVMAHYDSKSQSIPIIHRVVLVGMFYLGSVYILVHYIVAALWWGSPGGWLYSVYCLVNFSGILLLSMVEGNYSPGALDNASGVGTLLRLAEIISKERKRFRNMDITFVATGAEEEALAGAFHLCRSLAEDSEPKDNRYFINLDCVGLNGTLYCAHKIGVHLSFTREQADFTKLVQEVGKKEGLDVKTPPAVIGAAADHFPFTYEGLNAVTLTTFSKRARVIHTHNDGIDQLELEGLDGVGRLVLGVIEEIRDRQS